MTAPVSGACSMRPSPVAMPTWWAGCPSPGEEQQVAGLHVLDGDRRRGVLLVVRIPGDQQAQRPER